MRCTKCCHRRYEVDVALSPLLNILMYRDKASGSHESRSAVFQIAEPHQKITSSVLKLRGAAQTWVPDETQVQFWKDNGYLVVPDALPKETVAELLQCVNDSAEAIASGGENVRRQEFTLLENGCVNPNGRVIAALTERE
jgi:hypothetical protein